MKRTKFRQAPSFRAGSLLVSVVLAGSAPCVTLAAPLFPDPEFPGGGTVIVADLNGDGRPDLVVGGSVLLGNGDGTFGAPVRFAVGSLPISITVGDFNADGRQDLAVANQNSNDVSVLMGQGDGTFSVQTRFGAGSSPVSIAVSDFNSDGRQDLAVVNVFNGDGRPRFGGDK